MSELQLILREEKGTPLTNAELDGNFRYFNRLIKDHFRVLDSFVGMAAYFSYIKKDSDPFWILPDGREVSRAQYKRLFNYIGTYFGVGDGVNTFNLPNFLGYFFRNYHHGISGDDLTRALCQIQATMNLAHAHTTSVINGGVHTHGAWTGGAGGHNHDYDQPQWRNTAVGNGWANLATNTGEAKTGWANDHSHTVGMNAAGDHTHEVTVMSSGGTESRPPNISMAVYLFVGADGLGYVV